MKTSILYVYLAFIILVGCHQNKPVVLLEDGFEHIRRGPIGGGTTAHTEYQYMHEAAPRSKWEVSTFRYNLYKPERNPLYYYSNYQATISLPGWKD